MHPLTSQQKAALDIVFNAFLKQAAWEPEETVSTVDEVLTNSVVEMRFDQAPRDLFWANDFLPSLLQNCAQEQNVFDFSDLKNVFAYEFADGDGDNYIMLYASEKSGVFVRLSGYMGEYCDDNYDARATVLMDFSITPEQIHQMIIKEVKHSVRAVAQSLQSKMNGITTAVPSGLKEDVNEIVLKEFLSIDLFKPVLAKKSQQELQSHVDTVTPSAAKKPRKV